MPSPRWLLPIVLLLAACDDHVVQQRADEMRQFSNREDRAYTAEALGHIQRKYWTLRGRTWLGKLPDGRLVSVEAPHAVAAPLPSSAFYSGWHLQLTISSDEWRTYPEGPHDAPFQVVYAITRHSATSWDIRVTDGPVTSPLRREDAALLRGG